MTMVKLRVFYRTMIGLLLLGLAAACAGPAVKVVSTGDRYVTSVSDLPEEYKLGTGDKVRINVFNEPTLSGEFAVSSTGMLSLPLIGDVVATGQTPAEVATVVQGKLADGYLRDPKVSLEVSTYRPFFILGEVKAPGQYPYLTGLTVQNAVATAQGFTPRASKDVVFIRRAGATGEIAYRVSPDLRVLPGDTIRFAERYF